MVVIVDYGMGNLRSIQKKLLKLDAKVIISSDADVIARSDKIILPGVGHFKKAVENIEKRELWDVLNEVVLIEKKPILGICLGFQLFCNHSEEGDTDGLGWINAEVIKFNVSDKVKFKVPHIGWNNVQIINHNNLDGFINSEDQFYFVHSYHLKCNNAEDIWMVTEYDYKFVSAIRKNNIYGTQFHPEKSHDVGFELLKKFAEL